MKSFSVTSFAPAADTQTGFDRAVLDTNPLALFTDFQWFLFKAQNTVYFSAFSTEKYTRESLLTLVGNLVTLAPQLTHGFVGARPGEPLAQHLLEEITDITEVDEFEGYPDKWLEHGREIFDRPDLPLFRVKVVVRRGGPDTEGRASMIIVRSSHALMEGSDSALLSRSQHSGHGVMSSSEKRVPFGHKLKFGLIAALTAPTHLAMAHVLSPKPVPMAFRSYGFERARLRRLASKLGVGQRALMFGVVMHAMNGSDAGLGAKKLRTVYTTLDTDRRDVDDDFFRVRAVDANFDATDDLVTFIRGVDREIAKVECKDTTKMQFVLNATFKTHRLLNRLFPFIYGRRFFRFNNNYHMVLTLVPPHRMYGNLTARMMEPVYCGSFHEGSNLCTFVPGRKMVTFNFCIREKHLGAAERVNQLLNSLEMA